MNAEEFITYWQNKKDHDGSDSVGVGIHWDKIRLTSKVNQYFGMNAWDEIGEFYAPLWGGFDRTKLKGWLNPSRHDYNKFIDEEKSVGKIDLYKEKGLIYPDFCAFSDTSGKNGILGDGCHRYIDCNYLMMNGMDFSKDIQKCRLDVICVDNLNEVLTPVDLEVIQL
jgi:hypothetical protein